LLTRNSEKIGSRPIFSSPKTWSRPNYRRSPRCHSSSETPSGGWMRDSFGCLAAFLFTVRFLRSAFVAAPSARNAFARPARPRAPSLIS